MAKAAAAETNTKPVKSDKAKAKAAKPSKPSMFARLGQYFRDVRSEIKRVVWPNREEVVNSSVVVVVTLIFFVIFSLVVDTIFVEILGLISKIKVG